MPTPITILPTGQIQGPDPLFPEFAIGMGQVQLMKRARDAESGVITEVWEFFLGRGFWPINIPTPKFDSREAAEIAARQAAECELGVYQAEFAQIKEAA